MRGRQGRGAATKPPGGNRTTVTDAESHATSYAYNWQGQVKQITFADSRVEKHAFDAAGNRIAKLDGEENTIRYEYDAVNRLVKNDYPSGTDTTYTYNAVGRRTQMVDSTGTTTFAYDDVGKLTSVTYPGNKVVAYEYDNAGRRTQMTDPDSGETTYSYDNANRLTSLTNPNNETTSWTYNAAALVTQRTNANSAETLYTYNAANWITDVTNQQSDETLLGSFEYLYDDVGNRTQVSESVLKTDNQNYDDATIYYTYDDLYRLTEEKRTTSNFYWYVYEYDDAGNRTKLTEKDQQGDPTGTTNYSYDAGNKLQSAGNITYDWDDNGNLESKTIGQETLTYSYNYEDQMTQLDDGATYTFAYDGDGYRRQISDGTNTRKFIYDWSTGMPGVDPLVIETDGQGSTVATYTAHDGMLSQRRSSTTTWYLPDAHGSSRQLSNSSQSITDTYHFSAFGNTIASSGSTTNPFLYAGAHNYYKDTETVLYALSGTYYDTALGRFTQGEWEPDRVNLFAPGPGGRLRPGDSPRPGLEGWLTDAEKECLRKGPPGLCFWCAYAVYRHLPDSFCAMKACLMATRLCGSRVHCGPCGPGMSWDAIEERIGNDGCKPWRFWPGTLWLKQQCGGDMGNDKVAHCFLHCKISKCNQGAGLGVCAAWINSQEEGEDTGDIAANYKGALCGEHPKGVFPRPPQADLGCLGCCVYMTYDMQCN